MARTVLNVAYPFARVGPDAVGGAEQVLAQLDCALVEAGWRSLVLARGGSQVSGTLISVAVGDGQIDETARAEAHARYRVALQQTIERWPVDVVHLHGVDFAAYLPAPGVPVLATLHLPPAWYPAEVFALDRPHTTLCCVSASQRASCPPSSVPILTIPNGVAVDAYDGSARARDYVCALGRICPEKGFHLALEAARLAGVRLLLAGQVFPYAAHEQYFREQVVPRLGPGARFLGPIGAAAKRRLLSGARCLLVPSLVPETSSLVAMEALASGTPVVAFRAGALSEIVEHGVTGFLVDSVAEMAEAIRAVETLSREVCRERARERFAAERTMGAYLVAYAQLARGVRYW